MLISADPKIVQMQLPIKVAYGWLAAHVLNNSVVAVVVVVVVVDCLVEFKFDGFSVDMTRSMVAMRDVSFT